jgi:hypothetical protein
VKAFLIDPIAKTITEVVHNRGNSGRDALHDIYMHIGCTCVDAVRMDDGDTIYVDDEGLLKQPNPNSFWALPELYAEQACWTGKGLVLGSDGQGDTIEPKVTLDELKRMVRFLEPGDLPSFFTD